jgi:SAM-dependent methyltransferase
VAAPAEDPFDRWFPAVEARHLERLTFPEVRRGLQALSSLYVQRRGRLPSGAALDGAGKRAAFALFYAPLHFLLVRQIVRSVAAAGRPGTILDLGSGTGVAGAAWALECHPRPRLLAIDRNPWAVSEARWNLRRLGLEGEARRADVNRLDFRGRGEAILAAFTLNEMPPEDREALLAKMLAAVRRGSDLLIIEPIARGVTPWWEGWSSAVLAEGGRDDAWRFEQPLPERLRLLDRAAKLDHSELTGRSLWMPGRVKP